MALGEDDRTGSVAQILQGASFSFEPFSHLVPEGGNPGPLRRWLSVVDRLSSLVLVGLKVSPLLVVEGPHIQEHDKHPPLNGVSALEPALGEVVLIKGLLLESFEEESLGPVSGAVGNHLELVIKDYVTFRVDVQPDKEYLRGWRTHS